MLKLPEEPSMFTLLSDIKVIELQLILSATATACFGFVYLAFYRKVKLEQPVTGTMLNQRRRFVLLLLPLFVITCILCEKYGWHRLTFADIDAGGANLAGGMFTVTAYVKYYFVATFLYYLYRFGVDKYAWLLLGEHVIVMLIDGGRTTFLPIALLILFMTNDLPISKAKLRRLYIGAAIGVVMSIGARALIIQDNSLLVKMTAPVAIEGTMGPYSSLQSIYAAEVDRNLDYTYGASYVLDPFAWFLPTGTTRNNLSFFQKWVDEISIVIPDQFSPMGGFYYVSEAVAAFSFYGPALVTTVFGLTLVWIERYKNRFRLLYVAWIPTVGVLFVKTIFGNVAKMFIINLVLIGSIILVRKARDLIAHSLVKEYGLRINEISDAGRAEAG